MCNSIMLMNDGGGGKAKRASPSLDSCMKSSLATRYLAPGYLIIGLVTFRFQKTDGGVL